MAMKQRITKEQFNKLKQLDRIEFIQRKDYIEKYYDGNLGSWDLLNRMLVIIGFVLIIALLFYNINPSSTYRILGVIPTLIKLAIVFFVFLKIVEIVIYMKQRKEINKLEEEYFNFNVEVKR